MKFEIGRIDPKVTLSVRCHPNILLPWQRDVATSPQGKLRINQTKMAADRSVDQITTAKKLTILFGATSGKKLPSAAERWLLTLVSKRPKLHVCYCRPLSLISSLLKKFCM